MDAVADSCPAEAAPEDRAPRPALVRDLGRQAYEPVWRAMQRFTDKMWNEDAGEQGTLVGRAFGNFSDWIGLTDPRKRAYNRRREREQQAERLYGETMEEMERDQYRAEANARRLQDMAQSRANEQWYRTNKPKENVSPEAVAAAKKGPVPVVTGASTNPYTKTTPPPETPPKTTTA